MVLVTIQKLWSLIRFTGFKIAGQYNVKYMETLFSPVCKWFNTLFLQENAHFSISEALIAAIEQMKWNHVIGPVEPQPEEPEESDEEIQQLQQRIRIRKQQKMKEVHVIVIQNIHLVFAL